MFTGIVEEIGKVKQAPAHGRECLACQACKVLEGTKVGDSIAVNGVCLTVVSLQDWGFTATVMPETLRRTNLGRLRHNEQVNLERALVFGGRLGGHLVSGHVDDTGEVIDVTREENANIVRILPPAKLMPYIAEKSFIAVDGVSLTIVDSDDFSFSVSLVAYTMGHTTLGAKRRGDIVNLEVDIVAKYIERLSERRRQSLDFEFLRQYGFAGGTDAS
ncbi:MAG: riboflavin synthase [Dehalococcoidia bacterium]